MEFARTAGPTWVVLMTPTSVRDAQSWESVSGTTAKGWFPQGSYWESDHDHPVKNFRTCCAHPLCREVDLNQRSRGGRYRFGMRLVSVAARSRNSSAVG